MIYTTKGFHVVEADVFLEFPCFLYIQQMLAMWSSAFSKPSLCICKFSIHVLLKST